MESSITTSTMPITGQRSSSATLLHSSATPTQMVASVSQRKNNWYSVIIGRYIGVFNDWQVFQAFTFHICQPNNTPGIIPMNLSTEYPVGINAVSNTRLLHRQTIWLTGIWSKLSEHVEKMTRSLALLWRHLMWIGEDTSLGILSLHWPKIV